MDKLELDARVARLERRFSLLLTVPFLILTLLILAGMSMALVGRASVNATTIAPPPPAVVEVEEGWSMHRLDGELRKLYGLLNRGLIEREDFQAKKRGLFAPILHVTDFEGDMQLAKKLLDEKIIERGEYGELKKKILEIGG